MTLTSVDIEDLRGVRVYALSKHDMTLKKYLNILIEEDMKRDFIGHYRG